MSELSRKEIVQGFIETRKKQIEEGVSSEAKEKIEKEIKSFEAELSAIEAQEQAQQVRIAAHEENKEGLLQFIQELDIFETFFPQEKYAEVMGLSEYIDKRQSFNQVVHQAFVQVEEQRKERHDTEIAERDEKIAALKSTIRKNGEDHSAEVKRISDLLENENNELKRQVGILLEDIKELNAENSELDVIVETTHTQLNKSLQESEILKAEKEKLTEQLETYKSQEAPKVTSSLRDLLSQAKIKSAAELALESATPFRGKITLDVVVPPALEVPNFPVADDTSSRLVEVEPIVIPGQDTEVEATQSFPVSSGHNLDGDTVIPQSNETVSRAEFEELKAFVGKLELHIDGSVTWNKDAKGQVA